jgi:hypothetical protein
VLVDEALDEVEVLVEVEVFVLVVKVVEVEDFVLVVKLVEVEVFVLVVKVVEVVLTEDEEARVELLLVEVALVDDDEEDNGVPVKVELMDPTLIFE